MATTIDSTGRPWMGDVMRDQQERRGIREVVNDLLRDGKIPADLPWGSPEFQRCILAGIAQLRKYKADADKLAVITEVFGGVKT